MENRILVNGSPSMIHLMFKKSNPTVQVPVLRKRALLITDKSMML